ncbi:MAG: hypothetical protein P1U86_09630 [Verrucomicrobiales bacterium]|nr:hypothetical protein [Verrucomicrobiales bacterium]
MNRIFCIVAVAGAVAFSRAGELDYHRDVAPVLRDYCAGCHNGSDYEGEFSVETFAALMAGGETDGKSMVAAGKPEDSYLLQTIRHEAKPAMPPKKEPQLSSEAIDLLARWVGEGAKGPTADKDRSILSTLVVTDIPKSGKAAAPITAAAFSGDGKLRAVARYGAVELFDVKTGKSVSVLDTGDGKVNAVHFSSDGKLLVTASGITGLKGVATIREVATGKVLREIGGEAHRDILFDAEFSPDGKLLATGGYDRIIRLWEVATGKYLRNFPSHNGAIYDLAFSPDGTTLASASGDSTGKIWDVASGERLDTLNQPQGEQFRIVFSPDGKFIIGGGADNRVRMWRFLSKGKPKINPVVQTRFAHEDSVVDIEVSGDGKWLVTSSADRSMKLWSLPALQEVKRFGDQSDVVSAMAALPGSSDLFVARLDGSTETILNMNAALKDAGAETPVVSRVTNTAAEVSPAGDAKPVQLTEKEDGGSVTLIKPSTVAGVIGESGDRDRFSFAAKKGEKWVFEVEAARSKELKSKLDSRLAVLDSKGDPVERVVLQAVRDSWLTFRGKDSKTSGDFRVHNWREMELNEFLFVNGEVVKLWHYPRGPDSGFLVYPGFGSRHSFFETTALSHPLGQPGYIVRALPAGATPSPNGLPVYRLYYENDDESTRALGADSKVTFVAPADGDYSVEISDARGFGGADFTYRLTAREEKPDFSVKVTGAGAKLTPGGGTEVMFEATRSDGYSGPIEVVVSGLPKGLSIPERTVIEEGQYRAFAMVRADPDFAGMSKEDVAEVSVEATAMVNGGEVVKDLGNLGMIAKAEPAKFHVEILPDGKNGTIGKDGVLEFVIHPGETITALVKVNRIDFKARVDFGKEDSGRNLPHGVYIDNIGLNGLMIPEGKDEQRFFISAADWVAGTVREFHLRTTTAPKEGTQTVRLRVVKEEAVAAAK